MPHASPYTEVGPPDEFAIELARVVDRGLRHCGYVDFKKLSVEGGKAYVLWVDLYVINDDGNLVDAANLAAVAALKNAALPAVVKDETGAVKLDRNSRTPMFEFQSCGTLTPRRAKILSDFNIQGILGVGSPPTQLMFLAPSSLRRICIAARASAVTSTPASGSCDMSQFWQ